MKFVIRVLDDRDRLLAWCQVTGVLRPGGKVVASTEHTQMLIEADGTATAISIHWTDLDVARKEPFLGETELKAGQIGTFHWMHPLWVVVGDADVPLPAVTVRQTVSIGVPMTSLGVTVN